MFVWCAMNGKHCRSKANEFWHAAELSRDNLDERIGWLLLAKVWLSLAERLDETRGLAKRHLEHADRLRQHLSILH